MEILGIDIGGSGIKGAIVDTKTGELVSERFRLDTPEPATITSVSEKIKEIVDNFKWKGKVGCTFPSVVHKGKAVYSSNLDNSWKGQQVDFIFSKACYDLHFSILNDADAVGIAELEFGNVKDKSGTTVVITIGTGLGSAVFYNGVLIPNTEFGRLYWKDGDIVEKYASDAARKREELSYKKWGKRFNRFLKYIDRIISPDHIILGGGASKKLEKFKDQIKIDASISVAETLNNAGIIGAAVFAADH